MYSHLIIRFGSGHGLLRVATVLDDQGRVQLEHRLEEAIAAGCRTLEVDCGQVQHIKPASVLCLAAAKMEMERYGGSLVVRAPSATFVDAAERAGRVDLLGAAGLWDRDSEGDRSGGGTLIDLTPRIQRARRKSRRTRAWRARGDGSGVVALDPSRDRI